VPISTWNNPRSKAWMSGRGTQGNMENSMIRLAKAFLCAVSAVALIVPDLAAAAQHQPERQAPPAMRRAQSGPARMAVAQRPRATMRTTVARPPRTTMRTSATQPTRTVTRTTVTRPSRRVSRTTVTRPSRTTTRTAVSTRTQARRFPTFRIGTRPTTFHRIHAAPFRFPSGFHHRHLRVGLILPSIFLSSAFFFDDPFLLGLGPPPPGYVWVRYGPDLLLVNRFTGRIVDVIYGAFY
jgi:Ni/Co efflux regulator RcnB